MEKEDTEEIEKVHFNLPEKKESENKPIKNLVENPSPQIEEIRIPQKKNIFLMIILTIITLNISTAFWYRRRVQELNNLGTNRKISTKLPAILITLTVLFFTLLVTFSITLNTDMGSFYENVSPTQTGIFFSMAVLYLLKLFFLVLLAFYSRSIINEALENKGHSRGVSGFFTLIFNLFYIQYEINRIIEDKEDSQKRGPLVILILIILLAVLAFLASTFGLIPSA